MKTLYPILAALVVLQMVTAQTPASMSQEFDVCLTPELDNAARAIASSAKDQGVTDSLQRVLAVSAPTADEIKLLPINLQITPIWRRRWRCVVYYWPYKWCCWYIWWWF